MKIRKVLQDMNDLERLVSLERDDYLKEHVPGTKKSYLWFLDQAQQMQKGFRDLNELSRFSSDFLQHYFNIDSILMYLYENHDQDDVMLISTDDQIRIGNPELIQAVISRNIFACELGQTPLVYSPGQKRIRSGQDYVIPLIGIPSIQKDIEMPSNQNNVLGALYVSSNEPLEKQALLKFAIEYAQRLGPSVHIKMQRYFAVAKVTQEKALLEQQRQINRNLAQLEKAAGHDLRSLLLQIGYEARKIAKSQSIPPDIKEKINPIVAGLARYSGILDSYRATIASLIKGEVRLKYQSVDHMVDIIQPVLYEFEYPYANKSLIFDSSLGGVPIGLRGDADAFYTKMVWRNLLGNVLKYSKQGDLWSYGYEIDGEYYKFNVWNQGKSIPKNNIPKLFDEGFTGAEDRKIDSSGFGLSTVKEAVEAQGGRVWYEYKDGGNNFVFTLPIIQKNCNGYK